MTSITHSSRITSSWIQQASRRFSVRIFVVLQVAIVVAATLAGFASGSSSTMVDPRLVLPPLQAPGEWFDSQRSIDGQAIGSMARNGDMLLAGSGEANPGGGSIVYGGTGAYLSTDDGTSWVSIGLADSGAIGRVVEHQDGFLIAATGNLFVPGGERGLYRWAPGMDEPELWLAGPNDTTGAVDIAVDPTDPDHVLVAMWDHHRTPDARYYSGEGSGVYRTRDGGETWTLVADITTGDPAENGRMAVAFAPSDADRIYAEVANTANGRHGGFFVSDDGGETWAPRTNSTLTATNSSYGWWFGRIYVDPADADRVFVMGLNLTYSENGGTSFSNVNTGLLGLAPGGDRIDPHSDQHSMVFETREEGLVYLGNDGGVYHSTDNGESWLSSPDQGWTQHYSVDVSDVGVGNAIVTGLQDNGCQITYSPLEGDWLPNGVCGDGLESVFQPGNPAVSWSCSQYGGCQRNVAGAGDLGILSFPGTTQDRWGWLADIEYSPADVTNNTLYTGSQFLWKSTNNGVSWTRFTGDLSSDPAQLDPNTGYQLRGVVTAIAPGHEGRLVWVGTDEGRLWTIDASNGQNATLVQADGLPDAWVTSVTTDPTDDDTAWVTYSGFRGGSDAAHVFVTTDGGATFTDISGSLPNAPVNDIIVAGDFLVVGTDVGVFALDRSATDPDWQTLGTNLPLVPVIQVDGDHGYVTAATFGHGIQRIELPGGSITAPAPLALSMGQ